MKKVIILALSLVIIAPVFGQLSAKEKKKLKKTMLKKMKAMDAEDIEEMYNEYPAMKGKVASLEKKSKGLQDAADDAESKASECQSKVSSLESELEEARANAAPKMSAMDSIAAASGGGGGSGFPTLSGLVYKVQIGAFRNKDLSKYFDNHPNFGGDEDGDGTQKFTIGQFRKYWEADTFKKYMREMGVKDAWIVAYQSGQRISMKDARESETTE